MRTLILLSLVISHNVKADIITIPDDKYTHNVTHVTATIMMPKIETKTIAFCIKQYELKGYNVETALNICTENDGSSL